jgi:predicted phage terminase large subunit-like protein
MTNIKKRKNKTKLKKILNKIFRDKRARQEIVKKWLEIFFAFYFHHYLKYETASFQEEIFHILEDGTNRLFVLVAFRGSAKSTIVTTAYVLWSILGVQQKKFIIIHGQTEQKARQYLMNIKYELENNDLLKKDLGPFEEEKNQWGATALIIRKLNAKIMISSTEQSIRGIRHGEHRPDLIILDDVEDTNSVRTQEGRDKTFNWLTGEVIPAGSKEKTRIIAVGNLLHEDSLLKRLQQKIENGEMDGLYREYPIIDLEGNPLWPGKYPTSEDIEIEKRRVASNIAWAREYLLKIISTDEQIIQREWIKTYRELPPLRFFGYHAVSVDLAISKSATADCTAIVSARICGCGKDMRIYILPNVVNERLTSLETLDRVKIIVRSIGENCKIFIEDVQYQGSFVEHLRNENYRAEGVKIHGQDKHARLRAVSFLVQDGKVLFPEKGAEVLINQLVGLGIEKHDDLADAFSMLLAQVIEKSHRAQGGVIELTDGSDLNHLNSRAKFIEMEKRRIRAESMRHFMAMG